MPMSWYRTVFLRNYFAVMIKDASGIPKYSYIEPTTITLFLLRPILLVYFINLFIVNAKL